MGSPKAAGLAPLEGAGGPHDEDHAALPALRATLELLREG
jgi:hypothetical protein